MTLISTSELKSLIENSIEKCVKQIFGNNKQYPPLEDVFFTIPEFAREMHISVSHAYLLVEKRKIASHKQGKRIYILKSDMLNFIKDSRRQSVSEIQSDL